MRDYTTQLAIIFSREMVEALGDDLHPVLDRNQEYMSSGIDCDAAHDYLDANEIMMDCFKQLFKREPRVENQDDLDIINAAWRIAREQDYYWSTI
jgi:hypothetical protein